MTAVSQLVALLPPPAHRLYGRVQASPLGRRLAKGTFWSMAGALVARGMGLAASIVVARVLGKAGFGGLGIIQSTVGMFGVLAGLGLGTTATKYVAEFRSTDPARVGRIIALSSATSWISSALMAVTVFTAAPWLAAHTLNNVQLVPHLRIAALLLLLGGVNGAQTGTLAGFEAFRTIARINFSIGLLNFPCLVIGVWLGGLTGAVWGLVANLAANCTINNICVRREVERRGIALDWRNMRTELPLLWSFSLPVTLVSLVVVPATWISSTTLARSRHGYAALGEFTVGLQWRNLVMLLPMLLAGVAIPTLSNLHGAKNVAGYRKVLIAQLCAVAVLAAAVALGIIVCSPWIARSYGRNFIGAAPAIAWLAVAGFLVAVNSVAASAIISLGRAWTGLFFGSLCGVSLAISAAFLVPPYGSAGLAMAHVLGYTIYSFWQGAFLWKACTEGQV